MHRTIALLSACTLTVLAQTPQAREAHAQVPGARIWYTDSGGSGVPVVFLHAATGSSRVWEYQIPAFTAEGYRVIAFDRRGYGKTVIDAPGPSTGADDLQNLMNALKIDRFHLIGSAAGGIVAMDYALSYPERLRSLAIANSVVGGVDADYQELGRRLRPTQFNSLPPEFRELGPSYRASDPAGTQRWMDLEKASRAPGPQPPAQTMRNQITFAKIEMLQVPTLMLTGGADLYAPPPVMRLFADRIKNARFVIIPEAGHSAYWEYQDQFNNAVLQFLLEH